MSRIEFLADIVLQKLKPRLMLEVTKILQRTGA
jgi:hypothetical protein